MNLSLRTTIGFMLGCGWTIMTYAAPIAVDVSDLGWYAQDGLHDAYNINTLTGNAFGTEYRSFYVFSLPVLEGKRISSAALEVDIRYSLGVNSASYPSPDQMGLFFDVEQQNLGYLTQDNGGGFGQQVFADLGAGQQYGVSLVRQDDTGLLRFELNDAAVLQMNAVAGGVFAMGLRNITADPDPNSFMYFLFSSLSEAGSQRLLLDVEDAAAVPEPPALALLLIAFLGIGASKWPTLMRLTLRRHPDF